MDVMKRIRKRRKRKKESLRAKKYSTAKEIVSLIEKKVEVEELISKSAFDSYMDTYKLYPSRSKSRVSDYESIEKMMPNTGKVRDVTSLFCLDCESPLVHYTRNYYLCPICSTTVTKLFKLEEIDYWEIN